MKPLRLLTLLAVCCATSTVATVASAAEPAPAKPATPAATPPPGESAAPKGDEQTQVQQGTKTTEEDDQAPPAPKSKPGKGSSPERFVPSEQVRADFDVSFPIDI
ncbi:hypothetical protein [Peristeroidobacter agariperforans]|uniref:hypothetical protein n=1 Tax=Peristeroidobacter agariperforans TaxID=268404 RepID=UPI00101CFD3D|nr:hypothetical protein [Peristeroidobacter agariperforans]